MTMPAAAVHEEPIFLDAPAITRLTGFSLPTVYRLGRNGRMPAPIQVGRLVRWKRDAIVAWIHAGCPAGAGS